MEANYYKQYFVLEREHWYFKARNNLIMSHIQTLLDTDKKDLRILNVGAGTGFTSELLSNFGHVKSIEYDKECIEHVKKLTTINLEWGSILDLPYDDNSFDLVCAFDVIEHVEDDKLAIKELERVCRHDGQIVVTVPAFQFLWGSHDLINHHFRRYNMAQLVSLFSNQDNFVYRSYYNFFLFPIVAAVRLFNRLFTTPSEVSDFDNIPKQQFTDKVFFGLFSLEKNFILKRFRFPFGVSIICSYRN